ncbi:hypothetical protein ACQCN2_21220 [Brevibacillus ginsengisoli]|uniref:hypothetical protein n=1 Tax=Brevibacillus ginsengisoli TaxID=363854 RepID=UPI003CE8298E
METKSERIGKFLFLLLIVGAICSCLSLIGSVIAVWDELFYFDYVGWIDASLGVFNFVLGWLTVILFLFWIYHVHKDFRQIAWNYPVTPGDALARIIVPLYNLIGLWTVYSDMAKFLTKMDDKTKMYGKRLLNLIPFYYIGQMIYRYLNQMLLRDDNPSNSLIMWALVLEILVSLMYICMFVLITGGLKAVQEHKLSEQAATEG